VVGADKIHQAEVDGFDVRQGSDLPCLMQCAGRFNQHMHGDRTFYAVTGSHVIQRFDLRQGVIGAGNFRQDDIGDLAAGAADDDFQVGAPMGVAYIMDARAQSAVAIGCIKYQAGDHPGVLGLAAGGSAVLAVARDIEYRALVDGEFGLQLQGLAQVLFRAGVMLASGKGGEGLFPAIQNLGRMKRRAHVVGSPLNSFSRACGRLRRWQPMRPTMHRGRQ